MNRFERGINRFLISLLFSVFTWLTIDWLLIELPFWKYIIIELLLLVSMKFSTFTIRKLDL